MALESGTKLGHYEVRIGKISGVFQYGGSRMHAAMLRIGCYVEWQKVTNR